MRNLLRPNFFGNDALVLAAVALAAGRLRRGAWCEVPSSLHEV